MKYMQLHIKQNVSADIHRTNLVIPILKCGFLDIF